MKRFILFLATFLISAFVSAEKAKVMLVLAQHASLDRCADENCEPVNPLKSQTYVFVYRTNSSVEIYSDWNRPVEPFNYNEGMELKPGKNGTCEFWTKSREEDTLRYSISFGEKNTVFVTDHFQISDYEELYGPYKPDSFILSSESYKALKYDLLNEGSIDAVISFLNSTMYFWNAGYSISLIASNAKEYQILSGVQWMASYCGNHYELYLAYAYKNGILDSFTAEDKGDYGGIVFKKTLISDTEDERKYSEDINEFFEYDSHSVKTFDKKSRIWTYKGEAMGNRIWDFSGCQFPPDIVYMNSDELSAFLNGKPGF